MQMEDETKGRSIGNKKYEGYCIDLIEKIEEYLKIKCEFEIVQDGKYGAWDPQTKQWNGLIKQLLELVSIVFFFFFRKSRENFNNKLF
jgi:ionotropic glutamate receptor